jgi:integrase
MWTSKYITSLQPKPSHYSVRETGSLGFSIKVMPSGTKTFMYLKTTNGKRKQVNLGSFPAVSLLMARQKYRELLEVAPKVQGVARGIAPKAVSGLTLIDIWRQFENTKGKTLSKGTISNYGNIIYDISSIYNSLFISDFNRRLVKEYLTGIEHLPAKHNTALAALAKVSKFAITKELLEDNPVLGIEKLTTQHKTRKLSKGELCTFLSAIGNHPMASYNRDIILFILLTGARASEACGLPIEELDLESGRWILDASRSKNGKENLVPLNQIAIDLLERHIGDRKTGYVFTNKNGEAVKRDAPRQAMVRMMALHDMAQASLHDLRRTFAHHMNSIGIPSSLISEILNHAKSDITNMVYIQAGLFDGEDDKRHALNQWTGTLIGWGFPKTFHFTIQTG